MSFIQNLFTSRDNNAQGNTFVGQQDRIWWNPDTNAFYYSDGSTPGGIPIGTATGTGIPLGPINSVQLNAGGGNFDGSSNLVFSNNVLNVVGNVSATGNIQGNVFIGNGSQLTGVITSLGNAFATVVANGTSLVADSSADTVTINSGNNLVITSNAGTDTMTIAVADAPVFSGNVTTGNIIANAIVNDGSGNVYVTGNLLPTNSTYTLGLPSVPWGNAYFGPQSITIIDETGNIGNAVIIENIAANIVIGTTGFTINEFGTSNPIFRIEALSGQIFSNAKTIIQNTTNAANATSGSLQTAGGAGIAQDLYVGGNIYGTGAQLSDVVNSVTVNLGLSQNQTTGAITIDNTGVLRATGTPQQVRVNNSYTAPQTGNIVLALPQDIATNSAPTFANLTITGNLYVTGNTISGNTIGINGKILYLANNSTSNNDINFGGVALGNVDQTYSRSILYDLTNNRWTTAGQANSSGISNFYTPVAYSANVITDYLDVSATGHFGTAFDGNDFALSTIQSYADHNDFSQIVNWNKNSGSTASADFVAVNNLGNTTNESYFIDLGINSSTYANAGYAVSGPNDGYLFINGGNLIIGTQTTGNVIKFHTGGTDNVNYIRATISDAGLSVAGNVTGGNLVGQNLTAGRVAIVGSGKEITTDADFTYNSTTNVLSVAGNVSASYFSGNGSQLTGVAGNVFSTVSANGTSLVADSTADTVTLTPGNNIIITGNAVTDTATFAVVENPTFTGNVTGGNLLTTGLISATGTITSAANIAGAYILGNGSQLTGVIKTLGNAFTTISSNGVSITAATSTSTATLTPGNNMTIVGNASTNITVFSVVDAPVFTGNVQGGNIKTAGQVIATGNVTGNYFIGNGRSLTGVITSITPTALSSTVHVAAVTTGTVANIISDATTANTANTIVVRDSNGLINVNAWTINTRLTAVNITVTDTDYWIGLTAKNLTITLPNGANGAVDGRQYIIADTVQSGAPGDAITTQGGASIVGGTLSQQGQSKMCVYHAATTTWYCN